MESNCKRIEEAKTSLSRYFLDSKKHQNTEWICEDSLEQGDCSQAQVKYI